MIRLSSASSVLVWVGAIGLVDFILLRAMRWFIITKHPDEYWALAEIVTGLEPFRIKRGLLFRALIPLVTTSVAVVIFRPDEPGVWVAPGILGGVLAVWPVILNPRLLPYRFWAVRWSVYGVYALFVLAWGFLSLGGGALASAVLSRPGIVTWLLPSSFGALVDGLWSGTLAFMLFRIGRLAWRWMTGPGQTGLERSSMWSGFYCACLSPSVRRR